MTRLLLAYGGRSSEHEISIRSAEQVRAAVDRRRFDLALLAVGRDGRFRTGPAQQPLAEVAVSGAPMTDLRSLGPAVVFPLLHGPFGEDGTFQGLLELFDFPYVGSGVLASALCMDKAALKHHLRPPPFSVPVVDDVIVNALLPNALSQAIAKAEQRIGYPCFVKPSNQGSSVGVHRASDQGELVAALADAARFDSTILIEKAVDAREIELAVLGDGGPETVVSSPGEITLPPGVWYDYDQKYLKDEAKPRIPAELPESLSVQLQTLALQAFRGSGCHGLARVDFLVDRDSLTPYLNEVNTMPGFTTISMYPKLMEHAGVPYSELITRLAELGIERHRLRSTLATQR